MPVHQGYQMVNGKRKGYYQWGTQKKYYYIPGDKKGRENARKKAELQGRAIRASGYKGY